MPPAQVRALVDLLPDITVVENDPFNSDSEDPALMGAAAATGIFDMDATERAKLSSACVLCGSPEHKRALLGTGSAIACRLTDE